MVKIVSEEMTFKKSHQPPRRHNWYMQLLIPFRSRKVKLLPHTMICEQKEDASRHNLHPSERRGGEEEAP